MLLNLILKKRNHKQLLNNFQVSVSVQAKVEVAFIEKEAREKESKFIKKLQKITEIRNLLRTST